MRRTATLLALALFVSSIEAPEVQGGGGFAETGKVSGQLKGPAVPFTVVIDPTHEGSDEDVNVNVNPTKGKATIRVEKSGSAAGGLFAHLQAGDPSLEPLEGTGWVLGCNGTDGAHPGFQDPSFNVTTLTQLRFLNKALEAWMPAEVGNALFAALGIAIDPLPPAGGGTRVPTITDIDTPVCTAAFVDETPWDEETTGVTKHVLSFVGTIQFVDTTK